LLRHEQGTNHDHWDGHVDSVGTLGGSACQAVTVEHTVAEEILLASYRLPVTRNNRARARFTLQLGRLRRCTKISSGPSPRSHGVLPHKPNLGPQACRKAGNVSGCKCCPTCALFNLGLVSKGTESIDPRGVCRDCDTTRRVVLRSRCYVVSDRVIEGSSRSNRHFMSIHRIESPQAFCPLQSTVLPSFPSPHSELQTTPLLHATFLPYLSNW
jgi:hypothetical protein